MTASSCRHIHKSQKCYRTERTKTQSFHLYRTSSIRRSIKTQRKSFGKREEWEWLLSKDGVSFKGDDNVLRLGNYSQLHNILDVNAKDLQLMW